MYYDNNKLAINHRVNFNRKTICAGLLFNVLFEAFSRITKVRRMRIIHLKEVQGGLINILKIEDHFSMNEFLFKIK
jgi:hypothetical protein